MAPLANLRRSTLGGCSASRCRSRTALLSLLLLRALYVGHRPPWVVSGCRKARWLPGDQAGIVTKLGRQPTDQGPVQQGPWPGTGMVVRGLQAGKPTMCACILQQGLMGPGGAETWSWSHGQGWRSRGGWEGTVRALAVDANRKYASPVTAMKQGPPLFWVNLLQDIPTAKVFCAACACTRLSLITKTWRYRAEAPALNSISQELFIPGQSKSSCNSSTVLLTDIKRHPQHLVQKSWNGYFLISIRNTRAKCFSLIYKEKYMYFLTWYLWSVPAEMQSAAMKPGNEFGLSTSTCISQ